MHDAAAVGKFEASAGFLGDVDGLVQSKAVVCGILDQSRDISAAHKFGDHVGLARLFAKVEYRDYVRVGTQPAHGLSFTLYSGAGAFVQAFGFN